MPYTGNMAEHARRRIKARRTKTSDVLPPHNDTENVEPDLYPGEVEPDRGQTSVDPDDLIPMEDNRPAPERFREIIESDIRRLYQSMDQNNPNSSEIMDRIDDLTHALHLLKDHFENEQTESRNQEY